MVDERGMGSVVMRYFDHLFTTREGDGIPLLECLERRVSDEQNEMLLRDISHDEVRAAVLAMHPNKSPGPNGLTPAFF